MIKKVITTNNERSSKECWFGRCIFLSWYCDVGTCKFCYRSTQKSRIKHAENAKRSKASLIVEALLAKNLGWRIEFLTGGYKIYPMDELVELTKLISEIYGEKIWLNLGALKKEELDRFRPYIEGIVASIETIEPELHDTICPNKPIAPYEDMFKHAMDLKKSITIVIGLGEKIGDFELLKQFITKHHLDRITFYALKPVPGTSFTEGPSTEDYVWWITQTRTAFPKLEIIAGTTARRVHEISQILEAGADAITKFPATKKFGCKEAIEFEAQIKKAGRKFTSTLTKLPKIDWDKQIDALNVSDELKIEIKKTLAMYLKKMANPKRDDSDVDE
jgi:biotin synthase-like enzyme